MKLFKHSSGMIIAFGFDVEQGQEDQYAICWSGRFGKTWVPGQRDAGKLSFGFVIAPEFVHELANGTIVAYQPGRCIEITPRTDAAIFSFHVLTPDQV